MRASWLPPIAIADVEMLRAAMIDIALVISRPTCRQTKTVREMEMEKCMFQEVPNFIGGPAWIRARNQTVMSDRLWPLGLNLPATLRSRQ
jgi:hypothetical protein